MARLRGFQELTAIDDALKLLFNELQPKRLGAVFAPVEEALGRVTSEKIVAEENLPLFDRAAVDGYALKAKNTVDSSQFQPKTLHLTMKEVIRESETKEIWTGNPLPDGADAIVMLEHTKKIKGEIEVHVHLTPGANVSKKGEDVRKGEVVVDAGVKLKPHHLGLLAALHVKEVQVVRRPRVAIFATGSELVSLGNKPRHGQIVEVNSIILSGVCMELGAEPLGLGIAKDNEHEIREKIVEGLGKADIVVTTGGTSVGISDLVPMVIERFEQNSVIVHGIAMRPGMPTAIAILQNKPVIVLSGNPVAAFVGFEVFVRPLIQTLIGVKNGTRIKIQAKLTRRVAGVLGRRVFLRVKVVEDDGEFFVEPIRVKGSGIISTLTKANGYVIIPEDREGLREDELVTVHLFDMVRERNRHV